MASHLKRHLVIAAFWTEDDPEAVTEQAANAIESYVDHEPDTGGIAAIAEPDVDRALRAFLRTVNLGEAADA